MGIKYSELPKTSAPTSDDYVAILDNETATLKTTSLQNAVDSTLGTADISQLGDGTVKGAIVAAAESGGGSEVVELTQAEYDALPDTKLTDGKNYFITDSADAGKAAGVVVDPIQGLNADNVQTALSELNSNLEIKVDAISGTTSETVTYEEVTGIGYDSENNKLMIKVGASTEPIPFSGDVQYAVGIIGTGGTNNGTASASNTFTMGNDGYMYTFVGSGSYYKQSAPSASNAGDSVASAVQSSPGYGDGAYGAVRVYKKAVKKGESIKVTIAIPTNGLGAGGGAVIYPA